MFFSIDTNNGVAIYEQIVRQVKFAVADQTLRQGQLLPSVRVLSQQLAVNPNTLNRAFQQLQSEGVLESIRGKGLAVREGVRAQCMADRRQLLEARFASVVREALHAGLSAGEISTMVAGQVERLHAALRAERDSTQNVDSSSEADSPVAASVASSPVPVSPDHSSKR